MIEIEYARNEDTQLLRLLDILCNPYTHALKSYQLGFGARDKQKLQIFKAVIVINQGHDERNVDAFGYDLNSANLLRITKDLIQTITEVPPELTETEWSLQWNYAVRQSQILGRPLMAALVTSSQTLTQPFYNFYYDNALNLDSALNTFKSELSLIDIARVQ